jgi:hypothetical protein
MAQPRFFTAIGIAALLWNLVGDLSFLGQASIDTAKLAETDPDTARILEAMPGWAWASFAISVSGGTLGAVLLLMKRALAVPVFAVSLAAIVILFGHSFLATEMFAVEGWTSILVPGLILTLGVAQLLYARAMTVRGVLR